MSLLYRLFHIPRTQEEHREVILKSARDAGQVNLDIKAHSEDPRYKMGTPYYFIQAEVGDRRGPIRKATYSRTGQHELDFMYEQFGLIDILMNALGDAEKLQKEGCEVTIDGQPISHAEQRIKHLKEKAEKGMERYRELREQTRPILSCALMHRGIDEI